MVSEWQGAGAGGNDGGESIDMVSMVIMKNNVLMLLFAVRQEHVKSKTI
jgi:hypothetical protein